MATIYVSRNGNSHNLKLRDSEGHNPGNDDLTTTVGPGNTVIWEKDPYADPPAQPGYFPIDSIISIEKANPILQKYANSVPVLTANPTVVDGVGTGSVISPSVGVGKFENYTIGYTLPGDSEVYYDDPKLQMDS